MKLGVGTAAVGLTAGTAPHSHRDLAPGIGTLRSDQLSKGVNVTGIDTARCSMVRNGIAVNSFLRVFRSVAQEWDTHYAIASSGVREP